MKKKIMSIVLASVMVMAMSITAFAEGEPATLGNATIQGEKTMNGTGEVKEPAISVIVPTQFKIAVNPYKVPYELDDVTYNDTIVSVPNYIVNYSDVPIQVKVTDATVAKGNASSVEVVDAVAPTDTTKKIALQLDMSNATTYNAKTNTFGIQSGSTKSPKFKAAPVGAEALAAYSYTASDVLTLAALKVEKKTASVKATSAPEAVDETTDEKTYIKTSSTAGVEVEGKAGYFSVETTTKTPSIAVLKVSGSLVAQPMTAAVEDDPETEDVNEAVAAGPNEWDKVADALTLQVKFSFKAMPNQ